VTSAQAGTAIALAVAGWPLYRLVTAGDMDASTAVLRGAVVVVACVYGVSQIVGLATRFEAESRAGRKKKLNDLFSDMEGAVAAGTLVDPGTPAPGTQPGASPPTGAPPSPSSSPGSAG
jgi:hypothetical protein